MTSTAIVTSVPSRAVATQKIDHPIATQIREAQGQFAPFLPSGTDVEHVIAQVFLETKRVPALLKCDPASIIAAASQLVSWGFDIGRTAYLVPFGSKATPVPGYKGFIEMVLATGAARSCDAREVRAGDFFEYEFGSDARLRHVPGKTRGAITHFYVVWGIKFGATKFDVMTIDEVEDIRLKHSKQWGANVWARGKCEPWYGIKTIIRRSSKYLPQNPKLAQFFAALEYDQREEMGEAVIEGGVAEVSDVPMAALAPPAPPEWERIPDVAPRAATDTPSAKQVELVQRLANSHVWSPKEKAALLKRLEGATKASVTELIDKALEVVETRKEVEREAKAEAAQAAAFEEPSAALAGSLDTELPF